MIERDTEGHCVASVPQIHGCHTQAKSLDEVAERIREAISLCLEVEGTPREELEFVGIQSVTVSGVSRVPRVTGAYLIAALKNAGFSVKRIRSNS